MAPCPTGKSHYLHYGQTQKRADAMNRYRAHDGEYFDVYRCKRCGGYHIGGRDVRVEKARSRLREGRATR